MTMAKLFYIIGASGAGKDSLISYVNRRRSEDTTAVFAHRYITRDADAKGENHIALSPDEFNLRKTKGCFAMHWHSHQTHYGIGIEIDSWLQLGLNVVVNGSRGYLPQAVNRYPDMIPVMIRVEYEVMRDRLFARGRETKEQIAARMDQAMRLETATQHSRMHTIDNNGALIEAGEELCALIFNS
jgi:ribose 1,5-bisphosphokinase